MVGVTGFEPAASSSRTTRATKLRHTPKAWEVYRSELGALTGVRPGSAEAQEPFGSSVSRVASGRQHSRIGAYGEVPAPAETCSQELLRLTRPGVGGVAVQALGTPGVEVAVGDDRALDRQAHLAAVGVAGEGQVVAVAGVLVEHPQVRRVRDTDAQVDVGRCRAGHGVEVVVLQVRVVHAHEGDRGVADLEPAGRVGQVGPAAVVEGGAEVAPGQLGGRGVAVAVVGEEIPERVAAARVRSSRWSRRRTPLAGRATARTPRRPGRPSPGARGCRRC